MSREPQHDILFEPISLGPVTLRNRFVQVPHCNGAGTIRPGAQAEMRRTKAEGGWSAIFTELTQFAPEAETNPQILVDIFDDDDVANLRLMTDAVHDGGGLAGVELSYRLPSGTIYGHLGTRAPFRGTVDSVDHDDIRKIVDLYVEGAQRSRDAGFDLVTIYAAHGVGMLLQFLIPEFNTRSDEYGGSFENRARLSREILSAVRAAVGDTCAVGIRFMVDSVPPPYGTGLMLADGLGHQFIEHMDDLVDYWDVNVGSFPNWGEDAGTSRKHPENHQRQFTKDVKKHTSKPVINVGRFTNPDTMARAIRDGQCDLIGAARPSIADPFLPRKIEEGRYDDIRECIGCNMCVARWEIGTVPIVCTQNATMMEEFRRGWHPERFSKAANYDKSVLVIGAGPAGMECARVLGERGMEMVHLVDAEESIGGTLRWLRTLPGLGDWGRIVDYRQLQLDKLRNVSVITATTLGVDDVLDYGAQIVIVATGSQWLGDGTAFNSRVPIPGADAGRPNVITPEQLVVSQKDPGARVVIFDQEGYFMGHTLAARLAAEGRAVTFVTPTDSVAPFTHFTLESPRINREMREVCASVRVATSLAEISEGSATVVDVHSGESSVIDCDSVVLVTRRRPVDTLYRELRARSAEWPGAGVDAVFAIGDCLAPDFISEAVFSGHRLAREIDSPNPAEALPFINERQLATDLHSKRHLLPLINQ